MVWRTGEQVSWASTCGRPIPRQACRPHRDSAASAYRMNHVMPRHLFSDKAWPRRLQRGARHDGAGSGATGARLRRSAGKGTGMTTVMWPTRAPRGFGEGLLTDSYGRVASDLRVSLTDRCNLRCSYCMPPQGLDWLPNPALLTDDEIVRLVRIGVERLGISEVRYTGGEPLLRRGLPGIVARTAALRPHPEISLTTNGIGLARLAGPLHLAGLDRINVSLDTLRADTFRSLVDGGPAHVGVIGPVTRPFCGNCDRVRLTADGQVRNCLFAREESNLRDAMRAGASDTALADHWRRAVAVKLPGHGINDPGFLRPARPMSAIGG
jgi:molybdenum cofactor biosynthesis enzyme MoaA